MLEPGCSRQVPRRQSFFPLSLSLVQQRLSISISLRRLSDMTMDASGLQRGTFGYGHGGCEASGRVMVHRRWRVPAANFRDHRLGDLASTRGTGVQVRVPIQTGSQDQHLRCPDGEHGHWIGRAAGAVTAPGTHRQTAGRARRSRPGPAGCRVPAGCCQHRDSRPPSDWTRR